MSDDEFDYERDIREDEEEETEEHQELRIRFYDLLISIARNRDIDKLTKIERLNRLISTNTNNLIPDDLQELLLLFLNSNLDSNLMLSREYTYDYSNFDYGEMPLMWGVLNYYSTDTSDVYYKLLYLFMDLGINMALRTSDGETVLFYIKDTIFKKVMRIFLGYKSTVDAINDRNKQDVTIFEYKVLFNRDLDIAKFFIINQEIFRYKLQFNTELLLKLTDIEGIKTVELLTYLMQNFEADDDIKQQIFEKCYVPILNVCFIHFKITSEVYNEYTELIFLLDNEEFKRFAIKYMFIADTFDIISKYYDDKTIKVLTNPESGEHILRVFGKYDIPYMSSNFSVYSAQIILQDNPPHVHVSLYTNLSSEKQIPLSYFIVFMIPRDMYDSPGNGPNTLPNIDKYTNIIEILPRGRTLVTLRGQYYIQTSEILNEPESGEYLSTYRSCIQDYFKVNKFRANEMYTTVNYYSKIGDTCIHNILRGREFLNTLDRCKKSDEDIIDTIKSLNNIIWSGGCIPYRVEGTVILYRGTDLINIPFTKESIINSMRDQFVSFSSSFDIAASFGKVILKLILSDEDQYNTILPIEDIAVESDDGEPFYLSSFRKEREWLLPINTSFIVTKNVQVYDAYFIVEIKIHKQEWTNFMKFTPDMLQNVYKSENIITAVLCKTLKIDS